MGKPNTGHIVHLSNGKYKAIIELPRNGSKRPKKTLTVNTLSEAKKALIRLNNERERYLTHTPTIGEALTSYRTLIQKRLDMGIIKIKTYTDYISILNRLQKDLKDYKTITNEQLNDYYYSLKLSGATITKINTVFKMALKESKMDTSWMDTRPLRYNPRKTVGRTVHPLNNEEIQQLTEYFDNNDTLMKYIFYFTLLTGCRIGEVCGLKWSALHPENNTIDINNSVIYIAGKGMINNNSPKTPDSNRTLIVPPELFTMLKNIKHRGPFVFMSRVNTVLSPRNVLRSWKTVQHNAGLTTIHTFHDIRHTNITIKIAAGIDVKTVAIMAGHKDTSVTLNTYSHYWKIAAQRAATEVFNKVFIPTKNSC